MTAVAMTAMLSLSAAQAAKILRIGNDGEPQSMDPHYSSTVQTSRILDQMFMGLMVYGIDGEPVAGAAESWTVSEDGLTYTFRLRDHVWSDGVPVTSHDFVYAWRRILDPETGAPYASLMYTIAGAQEINEGKAGPDTLGARAIDDKTLEVTLGVPAPYFLAQLTHSTAMPLPRHTVEKYGEDWVKPANIVVNGPYILVEWLPNVHTKLARNSRFHANDTVAIDEVVYYASSDITAMQKRFRAGELDMARAIVSEQIDWLRANMADSLRIAPYAGTYYYVFRTDKEPFKDARVRKALSMAINRDAIVNGLMRTGEIAAYSFVPPGTGNYGAPSTVTWKDMPYDQALSEARKLLADAGYGPDNPLKFTLRYNTSENHKRIAVAIQAMWKQGLGVEAELFNTDGKIHFADLRVGNFQIARAGWIADYNDAQNFLYLLETRTGPMNDSKFSNAEFDGLMADAAVETDLKKRAAILARAEAIAMDGQPVAPIYYYMSKQLISPKVKGWVDNVPDKHLTRYLDLAE